MKKWAHREITDEERAAIPDRDDAVFDCNVIDHLEDSAGQHPFLMKLFQSKLFGLKNLILFCYFEKFLLIFI